MSTFAKWEVAMIVMWVIVGIWLWTLSPWAGVPWLLIIVPLRVIAAFINVEEEKHG